MRAQASHGPVAIGDPALFHKPAWRLGAEVDADKEDKRWYESRAELEAPGDLGDVLDDDVGSEAQEDSW